MVTFPMFAKLRPRPEPPVALSPRPLVHGHHSTPLLPTASALFCLTAPTQPFSFLSLPHSFHRNGGVPPSPCFFGCLFSNLLYFPLSRHTQAHEMRTFLPRAGARGTQKQGVGRVSKFLTRNSALTLESLLSHSDALFVRSFTKKCVRTPLQRTRSALFFKTAGCVGISNQILAPETFPHPPSYLLSNAQGGIRL
jgi:hypothetical protein